MWVGHSCPTNASATTTARRRLSHPQHLPPKTNPGRSARRKRQRLRRSGPPRRTLFHRPRLSQIRPRHAQRRPPHPPPRNRLSLHPPRTRPHSHFPSPGLGYTLRLVAIRKIFFAKLLRPPRLHRNLPLGRPHPPTLDHTANQPHLARLLPSSHQTTPPKIPRRNNRSHRRNLRNLAATFFSANSAALLSALCDSRLLQ